MPLAWLGDIASLERRVSQLEEYNLRSTRGHNGIELGARNEETSQLVLSEEQQQSEDSVPRPDSENYLTRSSPAIGLLATFARSSHVASHTTKNSDLNNDTAGKLEKSTEEALFVIYREKVHSRYPFLHLDDLEDLTKRPVGHWVGYFINMIISIGFLLGKDHQIDVSRYDHQYFYRAAVTQYLSHVFAQPERLLHIQAYLLLAMHAIYSPSTERIISIVSATSE